MQTLIVYGTKHGATEKCSKLLEDKLQGEVTIVNIKKESIPDLNLFDNIIIGGSIYVGQIQKEIKQFCMKNIEILNKKRIGLFVCCMEEKNVVNYFNNAFSKELLDNAIAKESFGGEIILKNMNFFERFITKKVAKVDKDISLISMVKVCNFADLINRY